MPGSLGQGQLGSEFGFRPARPADYEEVRRITRDAYLHAGHFTADHPYMSVLDNVEHRAEHAEVWVAEASGAVVAAVTLTFAGQPYSEIATQNELEFRMLAVDLLFKATGLGEPLSAGSSEMRSRCPLSGQSALRARRLWNGHMFSTSDWVSDVVPNATATFLDKTS